jgi:hypothetical protein
MIAIVFLKDAAPLVVEHVREIESGEYEVTIRQPRSGEATVYHPSQVAKIELVEFP